MAYFENLFNYSSSRGIIIPDTNAVKSEVERTFKEILGANLSTDASTPAGRMIEALTMLFVYILGVNAQNANGLNPSSAVGNWLDLIGGLFGIARLTGETDAAYRIRIRSSQSRGAGFVQSIWNAVGSVEGVLSVSVLENGYPDPRVVYPDPRVVPNAENGMAIDPHSIFVCVAGGDDTEIAQAIYSTKSAGCAYHNFNGGTPVDVEISDGATASTTTVRFYRPTRRYVRFTATVRADAYTGVSIEADTKRVITEYMASRNSNYVITKADLISAIGSAGLGIVCSDIAIRVSENNVAWINTEQLVLRPYQYVIVGDTDTDVTVI